MSERGEQRGEVLVAIFKNVGDLDIARDQHWYRIPISSVTRRLKDRWPPKWLAFYHTKKFGELMHAVHFYTRVVDIQEATGAELIPGRLRNQERRYYKLCLEPLHELPQPILSRRLRRIDFIPTTWQKLMTAAEINDLWDDSPLEDRMWAELKRLKIEAERQWHEQVGRRHFFLDFAIHCRNGMLDIETDGDTWHSNKVAAAKDNVRDNELKTVGWRVLRFNTKQIREQMRSYTIRKIRENIDRLGGLDDGRVVPRRFGDGGGQMSLFDDV